MVQFSHGYEETDDKYHGGHRNDLPFAAKCRELAAALLNNEWLMEQLKLSRKKLFGQSSEKLDEGMLEQLSLFFNEAEAIDAASYEPETKVKAHSRKRRSGSVSDVVPEDLPVERVDHALSEKERKCPVCGSELEEIGTEVKRNAGHHAAFVQCA